MTAPREISRDVPVQDQMSADAPLKLIEWALAQNAPAIATTSFSPYASVLLHMVTRVSPELPIVWMDSGYATPATYRYIDEVVRRLKLNLKVYHPRRSRAHREAVDGPLPEFDDPRHEAFTREVKIEPFERALAELKPNYWITGLRSEETEERAKMEAVSTNADGIVKVAPLLGWTSRDLFQYIKKFGLPNNFDYYDPTKGEEDRECGLHLAH
ncbi:MAG: phosphoadenosine phosphosulfate reductase family protein [Gammaproteobacteria bacterium]|nr:phosphoadenosine phosphosulfate reductase family protein [Gammaproteobacteria bacterium]